jgi:hypothetical protein
MTNAWLYRGHVHDGPSLMWSTHNTVKYKNYHNLGPRETFTGRWDPRVTRVIRTRGREGEREEERKEGWMNGWIVGFPLEEEDF